MAASILDSDKNWIRIQQLCGSGSKLDPYSSTFWIRIRIPNTDSDPHNYESSFRALITCQYFCIVLKSYFFKLLIKRNFYSFFKIDYVTVWNSSNQDLNWGKSLGPDSNFIDLDPQHWLLSQRKLPILHFLPRATRVYRGSYSKIHLFWRAFSKIRS